MRVEFYQDTLRGNPLQAADMDAVPRKDDLVDFGDSTLRVWEVIWVPRKPVVLVVLKSLAQHRHDMECAPNWPWFRLPDWPSEPADR